MFQRESLDILKLSQAIKKCDAILIGAGAGLSSAAGLSYSGNRFKNILMISLQNIIYKICIRQAFTPILV